MNSQQTHINSVENLQSSSQREDEFLTVLEDFLQRSSLEQIQRLPRWMM